MSYGQALTVAAHWLGADVGEARRHRLRGGPAGPVARAHHVAMYACHVVVGQPLEAIGQQAGVSKQAVSAIVQTIEDLRERDTTIAGVVRVVTDVLEARHG